MKRKNFPETTKVLHLEQKASILKAEISNELLKGVDCEAIEKFESPAQRYKMALIQLIQKDYKKVNPKFLQEFALLIQNPKSPIFSLVQAMHIYKNYQVNPLYIDVLQNLIERFDVPIRSKNFWDILLSRFFTKNSQKQNYFIYILSRTLSMRLVHGDDESCNIDLMRCFFEMAEKASFLIKKDINFERTLDRRFQLFFSWIKFIEKNGPVENQHYLACKSMNLLELLLSKKHITSGFDNKLFIRFMQMLQKHFQMDIVLETRFAVLMRFYELYADFPDFYDKQQFYFSKSSERPSTFGPFIVGSFFRDYQMPDIMLTRFETMTDIEFLWLKHVIKGHNIKSAGNLPLTITNKGAHIFSSLLDGFLSQAEKDSFAKTFSSTNYLIYSQLRALGVNHSFAIAFISNQDIISNPSVWVDSMVYLAEKGLHPRDIGPVVDYFRSIMRQENRMIVVKGRSVSSILNDVEEWHREIRLGRSASILKIRFTPSPIKNFDYKDDQVKYKIVQLLSGNDLYEEGQALHHCVFSYTDLCARNISRIFSLRKIEDTASIEKDETDDIVEAKRLLTIEVRNNRIFQIKGLFNRKAVKEEMQIIHQWAKQENLKVAC